VTPDQRSAPVTVRLVESGQYPDGSFRLQVSFGNAAEYDVTVADPADQNDEARLAWYFEQHLRYPFLDKDLEHATVQQITSYGEALFEQVFGGAASNDYRHLRSRGFDQCRIEVSGSAALHALHWEALKDPDLPVPLTTRLPLTRRVDAVGANFELPGGRSTLNILVLVARPDGPHDVGYRTISRPLMDSLRDAGLPITVDLVRPGTWQALLDHLRATTDQHGSGWHQVIHFDLHGSFSDYVSMERGRREGRFLFSPETLMPFAGRRGFLYFETTDAGKAAPVSAENVAALLAEHRVAVAVLNACQSAMQNASEAGLAQQLVEAGVPAAVGMAYSVTVSAAERAMPVLYGQIAAGTELTAAVHAARRDLYDQKARRAYFNQELELEDWMLPVMFAQYPVSFQLRSMTDAEQSQCSERLTTVGDEPTTEYGFVGRDLDIQAIEGALLADQADNLLLVHGMAGAGKSTLLAHLAWWWLRTGLVSQVFQFSYEDRARTARQIIRDIRTRLLPPSEHARADAMSESDQADQIIGLLRTTRNLLILDNIESATAANSTISHSFPPQEERSLKNFLSRLRGGQTLVLLGSRENEAWFDSDIIEFKKYHLRGLDTQAASVLVERILTRHHAKRHLTDTAERDALAELVNLLGGYPLPITVLLPVLASAKPSEVLTDLKAGEQAADPSGLIRQAVAYSHGKLDLAMQTALQLLAPFTAVIPIGPLLEEYREDLLKDKSVQALGQINLAAALDQAIALGLASPHPQLRYLVQVQPILPWFLRNRLQADPALRAATFQAHYQYYRRASVTFREMIQTQDNPLERAHIRLGIRAEYANCVAALMHGLTTGQRITSIALMLDAYLIQVNQHEARRKLFDTAINSYPRPANQDQQGGLATLHNLAGRAAYSQGRLDDALSHFESELQLWKAADDRNAQGVTYHHLGMVAHGQQRHDDAEACYQEAIGIHQQFGDQESTAQSYLQLGHIALEHRRYAEAKGNYQKALNIWQAFGKRVDVAHARYQLGRLAQEIRRYAEAEANYRKALGIFLQFDLRYHAAITYHQLGNVALSRGQPADAEGNYRKALDFQLELEDQHAAAGTYFQLGALAKDQERYSEAESHCRKALSISLDVGDRVGAALAHRLLGMIAQEQGQYTQAEASYQIALQFYSEHDPLLAAATAASLGSTLAMLGKHEDAVSILLYVVVTWREETHSWEKTILGELYREIHLMDANKASALIKTNVPAELINDVTAAINRARLSGNSE
jgi:tetratricopeptide (TPR) repeat protein